jgi:hypothetical protein
VVSTPLRRQQRHRCSSRSIPGAIDSAPTITDAETVLSAVFHNFVSLLIEAVEAEVGAIGRSSDSRKWVGGTPSLMHMLDGLSLTTGSDAGKAVGVGRFKIIKAGTAFATGATTLLGNPFGASAGTPDPLVFMMPAKTASLTHDDMKLGPICPRGSASYVGSAFQLRYAAHCGYLWPTATGGAPVSAQTFTVEGLIFYMPQKA